MTVATLPRPPLHVSDPLPQLLVHSGHNGPPRLPPAPPATNEGGRREPIFFVSYASSRQHITERLREILPHLPLDDIFRSGVKIYYQHLKRHLEWEPLFVRPDSPTWPDPTLLARLREQTSPFDAPDSLATPQSAPSAASRALRRRVIAWTVFSTTLAVCTDAALSFSDAAQFISLTTGIDPWMIAVAAYASAKIVFDKIYPPDKH